MGEQADLILNGEACERCGGDIPGPGCGCSRTCWYCDKGVRRREQKRVKVAGDGAAFDLAEQNGLRMRKCSDSHYQLTDPQAGWLVNLYPTTGRVCADPNRPQPNAIDGGLGKGWTLTKAVEKFVEWNRRPKATPGPLRGCIRLGTLVIKIPVAIRIDLTDPDMIGTVDILRTEPGEFYFVPGQFEPGQC